MKLAALFVGLVYIAFALIGRVQERRGSFVVSSR